MKKKAVSNDGLFSLCIFPSFVIRNLVIRHFPGYEHPPAEKHPSRAPRPAPLFRIFEVWEIFLTSANFSSP